MSADKTRTPFVTESTGFKSDLKTAGIAIAAIVTAAIAWGLTSSRVEEHDKRINTLETDTRTTREVLIRIDERTAEIKRRLDQSPGR